MTINLGGVMTFIPNLREGHMTSVTSLILHLGTQGSVAVTAKHPLACGSTLGRYRFRAERQLPPQRQVQGQGHSQVNQ